MIVTEAGAIPPRMDLSSQKPAAHADSAPVKAPAKENPLVADELQ